MSKENLILIDTICQHYQIDSLFINDLFEAGLVQIQWIDEQKYIEDEMLGKLETILRLHQDLKINLEGIDVVFNLLQHIENLNHDINNLQNKLYRFEEK